jgi:peptidase M28-like protein
MTLRDLGFYLRGRLNRAVTRVANARGGTLASRPLETVLGRSGPPLDLVPLLEGRSNEERQAALARHLAARGVPFARHHFRTFEGEGENYAVDLGHGDRTVVIAAHHDAVPGSPGANDNAAAVGILLALMDRLRSGVPSGLRVRLLFTAAEELGYLGARAYASETSLAGIAGVLSLELCGIGDSLVVWDAPDETPFLARVAGALEGLGLRRDESYHVVGRIPVFGSDHRAFASSVPAYGLSVVPSAEADTLRRFVFSPLKSALVHLVRRPPPFDTYHTSRDGSATLDPRALELVLSALEAIVSESRP